MPIYEYRCRDCGARTSVFFRSIASAENGAATCERCKSAATERLISRAVILKGTASRLEQFDADGALSDVNDLDVGSFARWARKMSGELGDAAGGQKFLDMAEKAEAGADPIERYDAGHTLRYQLQKQWETETGNTPPDDDSFDGASGGDLG